VQGLFNELRAALGPELAAIMTQRSLELTAETGITFDAAVISEEALGWARQYNYELVTGLTDTTRKLVQQSVSTFVETPGMTRADLEKLLAPAFGENRASMIGVTEVTRAYSEATNQHQRLIRDEVGLEMRRVWNSLRDSRVCPVCAPLHGMPEEEWRSEFPNGPPAHVNCILPGNVVAVPGLSAGAKSFYDGVAVEMTTAGGRNLTVTQNHPILTSGGWMTAKKICEGVNVVVCTRPERIAASVYPDYDHSPALVEQVFGALEMSGFVTTARVPAAAKDLHGDGRFVNGDIQIVSANSELLGDIKATLAELLSKFGFDRNDVSTYPFARSSAQTFLFPGHGAAASSSMGGGILAPPLRHGHLLPLERFGLGLGTRGDTRFEEQAANDRARESILVRQFLLRHAADIALDNVISIRHFQFCGHVYDLQSEIYGLYTSNGIVSSNCRCSTSLTMDDEATVRAEAIAGQTARERAMREKVEGEKVPVQPALPTTPQLTHRPAPKAIAKADQIAESALRETAERMGLTPEEVERLVANQLAKDLQNPLSIRRGVRGATNVLEAERFKTCYEVGGIGSNVRKPVERKGLGYPISTPANERPIYGYVSSGESTVAHAYGRVEFELKPEVKARATITLRDSFEPFKDEQMVGTPLLQPSKEGWDGGLDPYLDRGIQGVGYIETQIQGGVSLDDVSRIIVRSRKPEYDAIIEMAKNRGIEVVIDDSIF